MSAAFLIDERFVALFPSLVRLLDGDIAGAAILQNIHYRLQQEKGPRNERSIVLPLREIADDLGISRDQAKRAVIRLKDSGLLAIRGDDRRGTTRRVGIEYDLLESFGTSGAKSHHSEVGRISTTSEAESHHNRGETAPPFLYIRKEENKKGTRSKVASPAALEGERISKEWWERQSVKPAGARAWHSLKASVTAVVERGWKAEEILRALDKIASVPSVAQLDRELRNPRSETWAERKSREESEERAKIEARRERERLESEERLRRMDEEKANAVPPPPEFREAVRRLRSGRAS